MSFDFNSRVIFITGASRGIGKALAEQFAAYGAKLALVSTTAIDRNEIGDKNAKILLLQGDVANYDFVKKAVQKTIQEYNKIDVLVNVAGILGPTGLLPECDPEAWMRAINVNLGGVFFTMHEVLPHMIKARQGKIINFAGGGAAYSYPNFSAYASSKVSVVRLTETVADEVSDFNIQVNVIAPGAVATDLLQQVRKAGGEVRTVVTMDKPVRLATFLASEYSNHITGRFIHANDEYEKFSKNLDKELYKLRRLPLR